jgi:hypothetical protein
LKDGQRVTSMWFSAKHFQIRKTDRPMSAAGAEELNVKVCAFRLLGTTRKAIQEAGRRWAGIARDRRSARCGRAIT